MSSLTALKKFSIPFIKLAFFLCIIYWIYMVCLCEMVVADDSIGYEDLGKQLVENGWIHYLKIGPSREPLYPLFISWSMHLAKAFSISYQTILMFMQIGILFISQLLLVKIFKKLNIHSALIALGIFYFGFSISVLSSALRLYSEILAYPLMLTFVLFTTEFLENIINNTPSQKCKWLAFGLSLNLLLLTFHLP